MKFSINLTVHNKVHLIERVLDGIISNTTGDWELVVCYDGCTDGSDVIADRVLLNVPNSLPIAAPNVFETKANNLTSKFSSGEFLIFVQDDMIITERGWNERIVRPIEIWGDVWAVTARTAHSWRFNLESRDILSSTIRDDRWCDILEHYNHADVNNTPRDIFAIRDTVNRGPLAVRADIFHKMGGFDEIYAPLSFDDHDLMYRVRKCQNLLCGYYNIGWYSEPGWGGTRNADGSTRPFMYAADHKNSRIFHERHLKFPLPPLSESRFLG